MVFAMKKYLSYLPYVAVFGIFVICVAPIVEIQFRLWRNGAIGTELAESLRKRFPGLTFRSGASYQKEVIYITIIGDFDDATLLEVEQCLRAQKAEQHLSQEIWLNNSAWDQSKRILLR